MLSPQEHDRVFAAVSHLPHLLAYALVDDIANKPHAELLFQYAASGFRDFTRIAGSSPEMWRDISLANRDALLGELDAYLAQLSNLRGRLAASDGAGLEAVYANAQRARCAWIEAIEAAEQPPRPGSGIRKMTQSKHYPQHIDLEPVMHVGRDRPPAGLEEHLEPHAAAGRAGRGHDHHPRPAGLGRHPGHARRLHSLGIKWEQLDERTHVVHGGGGHLPNHEADLFMGNAGTAIRPLTAALAVIGGDYTLHGVSRMHERPIGDLVDALNAVGAQIEYTGNAGYPPLRIRRGHIHAARMSVRGNVSSQFLTALLMAAPLMAKDHAVTIDVVGELISKPYIEITLNLMRRFGVTVEQDGWASFTVQPGQRYQSPGSIHVEGDASSASYFLAAGAIAGGPVRVEGVGRDSIQGDVRFADALELMGATITRGDNWIEAKSNGVLKAIDADFNHIPDAAMTIAVAACTPTAPAPCATSPAGA
jgi:3-phosphoshikimate 1-carboxyvinyltransferase